jgi:hypothetical protein
MPLSLILELACQPRLELCEKKLEQDTEAVDGS